MRSITIDWSYPMEIDNILADERMLDIGIYYITRNFGGHISDLYIGKTIYSYKSRLEAHWWYWLDNYRGKKMKRCHSYFASLHTHDALSRYATSP